MKAYNDNDGQILTRKAHLSLRLNKTKIHVHVCPLGEDTVLLLNGLEGFAPSQIGFEEEYFLKMRI